MSEDQKSLKLFLHEAKQRADVILGLDHINNEAKTAIKDLLIISQNYERLMSSNVATSSDASLLKKRYELSKSDLKKAESVLASTKAIILSMIPELVIVSAETNGLIKSLSADPENPMLRSVLKMKQAVTKIAEAIAQTPK